MAKEDPMSKAQRDYLESLVAKRDPESAVVLAAKALLRFPDKVTQATASQHITKLVEMPYWVQAKGIKLSPSTAYTAAGTAVASTATAFESLQKANIDTNSHFAQQTTQSWPEALPGTPANAKPVYSAAHKPEPGLYDMYPNMGAEFVYNRFWLVYKTPYGVSVKRLVKKYTKSGYGWDKSSMWAFCGKSAKSDSWCTKMAQGTVALIGKKIGMCMCCGKTLTVSADIGIGPICAKNWIWE